MSRLFWLALRHFSWRRFVFGVKAACDLYLYGEVLLPVKHCAKCGLPIEAGQLVTGAVHAACLG